MRPCQVRKVSRLFTPSTLYLSVHFLDPVVIVVSFHFESGGAAMVGF